LQAHFTSDGQRIITLTEDGRIISWDVKMGTEISSIALPALAKTKLANFSGDLSRIAIASDTVMTVHATNSGEQIASLRGHNKKVTDLAFSPEGLRLVSVAEGDASRLWNLETGQQIAVLQDQLGAAKNAAFSSDGTKICTVGTEDNRVQVWDGHTGQLLKVLQGHTAAVTTCKFLGDSLITSSADKTVQLWDIHSGETLAVIRDFDKEVELVTVSLNQRFVAAIERTGEISILDLSAKKRFALNVPDPNNYWCSDARVEFTNSSDRLAVTCYFHRAYGSAVALLRSRIIIYDPASGAKLLEPITPSRAGGLKGNRQRRLQRIL
jgi:WD40 repeat protein